MASQATDTATADIAAPDTAAPDTAAIDASSAALPPLAFIPPGGGGIVRVSTDAGGGQANGDSSAPAVSGNGRFVAFGSFASNLVPGDANGREDVFVKNLRTGQVTLASADANGTEGNGSSTDASLSANGRFVAFDSDASNLVPGGADGAYGVFVKDLRTGQVTLASTAADGTQANAAFAPSISGNGRLVAFQSAAALVPGDANGTSDIFVKDLRTGQVTLASAGADGTQGNGSSADASLSANGAAVAFDSNASNLAPGDANGTSDVFVKDLRTGQLTLASATADGTEGNAASIRPSLSANGRLVAFQSFATNLAPQASSGSDQVYVKDLGTGQVTLASADAAGNAANFAADNAAISPNGRYVSFQSDATNLVPGSSGLSTFLKDLQTGRVSLIGPDSTPDNRGLGEGRSAVTNAGAVVFASSATTLVPGDTNGASDIFLAT